VIYCSKSTEFKLHLLLSPRNSSNCKAHCLHPLVQKDMKAKAALHRQIFTNTKASLTPTLPAVGMMTITRSSGCSACVAEGRLHFNDIDGSFKYTSQPMFERFA
jgi:hypothetical protein